MLDAEYSVVTHDELKEFVQSCFAELGLRSDDAAAVAEVLSDANLRGVDSHGLDRLPVYMQRVHAGLARGTEEMRTLAEFGGVRQLDAGYALGPAAASKAVNAAVDLAREHTLALVSVRNSGHFGAAGFYARRAAEAGMVLLLVSNAPKSMLAHGARDAFLGANPVAVGVPLGDLPPFVLDISSSIVARGKIRRAHVLGKPIPAGLAVDREGEATDDPVAALAGSVLPLGGVKGSGLAFAITLMTGLLAGAAFDDELGSMYDGATETQNIGHVFIAVDPWRFGDRASATRRMEALVERLHSLRPAAGFERVYYAGERGAECARHRLRHGIPVARQELLGAADACAAAGLEALADRARRLAARSALTDELASTPGTHD
jgi:LDH2 family malate/lactate/ureidoglycolate dehydrogenase